MFDNRSHLIYLCTFILSIFCAYLYSMSLQNANRLGNKYSSHAQWLAGNVVLALSLLPPIILYTFRINVGTDYSAYESLFEQYSQLRLADVFSQYKEPGYVIINIVAYRLFGNYRGYLFLNALLTIIPVGISLTMYNARQYYIGLAVYLLLLFPSSFNAMRQFTAISFIMLSLVFCHKRKWILYIMSVGIAALFHKAAVFAFLYIGFYLMGKKNLFFKALVLLFVCTLSMFIMRPILCVLIRLPFFGFYFNKYIETAGYYNLTHYIVNIAFRLPLIVVLLVYGKKLIDKKNHNLMLIFLPFLDIVFIFYEQANKWIGRMTGYTMAAVPFVIMLFIINVKIKKQDKVIVMIGMFSTLILRFLLLYSYSGVDEIYPYQFVFS